MSQFKVQYSMKFDGVHGPREITAMATVHAVVVRYIRVPVHKQNDISTIRYVYWKGGGGGRGGGRQKK